MYTIVFYNADTLELVMTQESGTKPKIKEAKHPFYIQEGAFDGVVDPSKGIDNRTNEQQLQAENDLLKQRVESLESAMDFVMEL